MNCLSCSRDNADNRKFCSECGSLLVTFCMRCGFGNSLQDKYCGGCGVKLGEQTSPGIREAHYSGSASGCGKYSEDDLNELLCTEGTKAGKKDEKKEIRNTDTVSQDLLDSIFDSSDSD